MSHYITFPSPVEISDWKLVWSDWRNLFSLTNYSSSIPAAMKPYIIKEFFGVGAEDGSCFHLETGFFA